MVDRKPAYVTSTVRTRLIEESKGEYVFKYKDKNSLGSSFRKVLRGLEIKDLCFHSLRHTFASNLAMKGVDLTTIQELLGHKSIVMTKRYAHPTPEHKKQA
ncbi:MAG TPA: tyrosine-type recombinase/integrase [Thermodesulfobacteriota bacterium]|nr:tyrosine-type recombinase/integrase [Thermodesulfobacteriota bacterium]